MQKLSPYRATKVAIEVLGYDIPPQMVYSYVRKGLIPSTKSETGHIVVTDTDVKAWAQGILDKKAKAEATEEVA